MEGPFQGGSRGGGELEEAIHREHARRQRAWRRRMWILAGSCALAFGLTALWLTHLSTSLSVVEANAAAAQLVRQDLIALGRGDYRAAYAQFSPRYRRAMPFELFAEMIAGHGPLMRGSVTVMPESATPDRVVLHVNFEPSGPTTLTAEFTLVRAGGRWWIDDVRWGRRRAEPVIRA